MGVARFLGYQVGKTEAGVNVRPARPSDADLVVELSAELNAHERRPARRFNAADFRRDGFGAKAAFTCLIVEQDGEPAGYALFHPSYDAEMGRRGSFVHDLYLRPDYRRRGLGRALLAGVCRETRARGGEFVWWCMVEGNLDAEGFYRSLATSLDDLKIWIAQGDEFLSLAKPKS